MARSSRNMLLGFAIIGLASCNTKPAPQISPLADRATVAGGVPDDVKSLALSAKDELFSMLSGRLMEVMQSDGPAEAIKVCSMEANEIAETVSNEQGVKIGRTSIKLRNPENQPPAWARDLVSEMPGEPRFARLDNNTVGALLPIKLQVQCLMCHGRIETLAPGVPEQLAKLYPEDQATGYAEGDLRGWFWVEVPMSH